MKHKPSLLAGHMRKSSQMNTSSNQSPLTGNSTSSKTSFLEKRRQLMLSKKKSAALADNNDDTNSSHGSSHQTNSEIVSNLAVGGGSLSLNSTPLKRPNLGCGFGI